jgi:hypothetical protein
MMGRKKTNIEDAALSSPAVVRPPREATLIVASCEKSDGQVAQLRVRNLSETGFGGVCAQFCDFDPDELVRITFRGMSPIAAKIERFDGRDVGISFVKRLDLNRVHAARIAINAPQSSVIMRAPAPSDELEVATKPIIPPVPAAKKPAAVWQPPALKFGKRGVNVS